MKYSSLFAIVLACFVTAPVAAQLGDTDQEVIAFWDFNDAEANAVPDETPQIVFDASIGNGTIYQQRADTDGNGKGGNDYTDVIFGIVAPAGRSLAWDDVAKGGSDNDGELFLSFSTTGFEDIRISFDIRGNADGGITAFDLKYDNNPLENIVFGDTTIKDFAGGNSATFGNNFDDFVAPADSFSRLFFNLTGQPGVDNQAAFAFRIDDFDGNDDVRFDNVLVTGVPINAVPEPTALAVLALSGMTTVLRRRRTA